MSTNNVERVMVKSNIHIININKSLKEIKLDNKEIVITTNTIVAESNMKVIEKYIK